jgi:metal-dependent hydrolase (beta-lactamase superfamily II)
VALVERVTRAVERELSQIEVIVGGHHVRPQQRTEAERRARTLASLARTLTELRKLRAEEDRLKPHHDDGPADIDEFRRALSQKLARLVRESKELYPGEPDGAGTS